MADTGASHRGDPHGWNSLENYVFLHEKHLYEHPLVRQAEIEIRLLPTSHALYDAVVVEGIVHCKNGLRIEVFKTGDYDRTTKRVRMTWYTYNAWWPGAHNALRYDNSHKNEPDVYHRHEYDRRTGEQITYREMTRAEFPVMHEIFDELLEMYPLQAEDF